MAGRVKLASTGQEISIETLRFRRCRKKPVEVMAFQTAVALDIETLEGTMRANPREWIIKGIKGEIYPCKPDIFEQTYELLGG